MCKALVEDRPLPPLPTSERMPLGGSRAAACARLLDICEP